MSDRSDVWLKEKSTGRLEPAILIHEMETSQVIAASNAWKPFVEARRDELFKRQASLSDWPQHSHWDWEEKAESVAGILAYNIAGIECREDIQGLVLLATDGKLCTIPSQRGKPLVYVHFLATAPWNDPNFTPEPRFGLVGLVFLAYAVMVSKEMGFNVSVAPV